MHQEISGEFVLNRNNNFKISGVNKSNPLVYLERGTSTWGPSLVAQMIKNPPAMQETRVQSLGRDDPLGKGMATHSRILAWRILWTEEPGGLQSKESQRVGHG